jgi:serine O-acetyltransferase
MSAQNSKHKALRRFIAAVRADYASVQKNREKYHNEKLSAWRMPIDAVKKIGFQTLLSIRLMQLCRDLRIPVAPMVLSRAIRHLYSSEIHWDADIAPGISIVHGVGLVISHAATVGEQCILFHNVTLGEGLDKETKQRGAPTLESRVHVGPGATLLGPIVVGEGSKIGAGAVLDHSVPPHSLVMPASAKVTARAGRRQDA